MASHLDSDSHDSRIHATIFSNPQDSSSPDGLVKKDLLKYLLMLRNVNYKKIPRTDEKKEEIESLYKRLQFIKNITDTNVCAWYE